MFEKLKLFSIWLMFVGLGTFAAMNPVTTYSQPTSQIIQYTIEGEGFVGATIQVFDFKNSFGQECTLVRDVYNSVAISVDCN